MSEPSRDREKDELPVEKPRVSHCLVASHHAARDMEYSARAPEGSEVCCECVHCSKECDCP